MWAKLESKGDKTRRILFRNDGKPRKYYIGRHPECHMILSDMHISSRHLCVSTFSEPSGARVVTITDDSSNGTWLDGVKLEKGVEETITDGSEIFFPCENDDDKTKYTFRFTVNKRYSTGRNFGTGTGSYANATGSYGSTEVDVSVPTEQDLDALLNVPGTISTPTDFQKLREVIDLHDKVSLESARLSACVYTNGEVFAQLLQVARSADEQAGDSSDSEEQPREGPAEQTYGQMKFLLAKMLQTMAKVNSICEQRGPTTTVDELSEQVQDALCFDVWAETLKVLDPEVAEPAEAAASSGEESESKRVALGEALSAEDTEDEASALLPGEDDATSERSMENENKDEDDNDNDNDNETKSDLTNEENKTEVDDSSQDSEC